MRITGAVAVQMAECLFRRFSFFLVLAGMVGCAGFSGQRVIYDQAGARIGIETDPSVARSNQPVGNVHPANVSAEDIGKLLGVVQVSGWSGTIAGIFDSPRPVPLFTDEQLKMFSVPLSDALGQAGPTERVFFSFPKPEVAYSEDRTAGAIFLRGRYLHVVVTDHASVIQADTGGGDPKDIRDTKGMKLWVARPAEAATVPDLEEPRWAPFETVHVSLNVKNVLASRAVAPSVRTGREGGSAIPIPSESGSPQQNLQSQIRELTNSNSRLKDQLDEQKQQMKALTEEMNRLRLELDQPKPTKPLPRKSPSP